MEFQTVEFNPRFPQQNQTRHCWSAYVEYQKCKAENNGDDEPCKPYHFTYTELCPNAWVYIS